MEPSAIERDLDELETRMERLRALYEQYFMGLEKLEPQIPRKEVERRMHLLRKEQIRNTALRFKFQMLIQRYNTLQQYWARVTREIENGTYRRDVMRAAARFGAKDALTILGKRRAQKYAALAEAQAQRKEKEPPVEPEGEEVELDSEDLIDDDGASSVRDTGALDHPATFLPLVTADPAQLAFARRSSVEPLAAAAPAHPRPAVPATAGLAGLRWGAAPRRPASQPHLPQALLDALALPEQPSPAAPGASPSPDPKSAIRSTEAAIDASDPRTGVKRRVAELAEAMRASAAQGPAGASPRGATASSSGLDLDLEESRGVGQAVGAPPQPFPPEVRAPSRPSSLEVRASTSSAAIAPPPAAAPSPARSPFSPVRALAPVRAPAPAPAPRPQAAAAPAGAPADGVLPEQRIRQIYAKYVDTKRRENESTAGVTYDKLAETLRVQTQRLQASHPTKTVDYEVVVKDGKTQLKPILK